MHLFPNIILSPKGQKPAIYSNTGDGRDTYVSYNNGGNFPAETRLLKIRSEGVAFKTGLHQSNRNTNFFPQRLNYFSDGTGRDSYIVNSIADKVNLPLKFQDQLRDYAVSPGRLMMKLPPIEVEKRKNKYRLQKQLTQRLSCPKFSLTTLENDISIINSHETSPQKKQ